jgi:hypothetical protein
MSSGTADSIFRLLGMLLNAVLMTATGYVTSLQCVQMLSVCDAFSLMLMDAFDKCVFPHLLSTETHADVPTRETKGEMPELRRLQ